MTIRQRSSHRCGDASNLRMGEFYRRTQPSPMENIFGFTLLQHRHFDTVAAGSIDRLLISCICMPHDAQTRIGCQDAFQTSGCFWRAVSDDHLSGMLAEAYTHPPPMVEGNPGGAPNGIDQGVQDRPIAHRIRNI